MLLILAGALLLLHNYRGLDIGHVIGNWWPLILVMWGVIKIYERSAARKMGEGGGWITGGEIGLVTGLFVLMGGIIFYEYLRGEVSDKVDFGEAYTSNIDVAPKAVTGAPRVTVRTNHGDITVRSSDEPQIRVSAKKTAHGWSESDARRLSDPVNVEIAKEGDGWEVRPTGSNDSRVAVDLDVAVPRKTQLAVRNERGTIDVSDMGDGVSVNNQTGNIDVRDTTGDVSIETKRGNLKVSDTKGNVKISGHGGEIEVVDATGGFTLEGEFYGPIRADRIAKGVRFVSQRTDLTLNQLTGHMEAGSGNIEISDAPGNLTLRTNNSDVSIENPGGKVKIDNRSANIEVRFSSAPKDDIEITNSSASITLSIPASSSFQILADCHSGDIESEFEADSLKQTKSESGDARLEGKYGTGRPVKILLKTSYGSITIHKTS